ncbi:MAG: hypothetical protein ACXAC7_07310 [Candidatus Hodarchaeales archaeon]|jgi:hypothetical protein
MYLNADMIPKSLVSISLKTVALILLALTLVLPIVQISFEGSGNFISITTGAISLTPDTTFPGTEPVQKGMADKFKSDAELALNLTSIFAFASILSSLAFFVFKKTKESLITSVVSVISFGALFIQYYLFNNKDGRVIPLSESFSLTVDIAFGLGLWVLFVATVLIGFAIVVEIIEAFSNEK